MPTLIIDDSRPDRALLMAMLKGAEHPWVRGNRIELRDRPPEDITEYAYFRFVFLDYRMLLTDGVKEARRIRTHYPAPGLPHIVLMSGHPPELTAEEQALFIAVMHKNPSSQFLDDVRDVMRHYDRRHQNLGHDPERRAKVGGSILR